MQFFPFGIIECECQCLYVAFNVIESVSGYFSVIKLVYFQELAKLIVN